MIKSLNRGEGSSDKVDRILGSVRDIDVSQRRHSLRDPGGGSFMSGLTAPATRLVAAIRSRRESAPKQPSAEELLRSTSTPRTRSEGCGKKRLSFDNPRKTQSLLREHSMSRRSRNSSMGGARFAFQMSQIKPDVRERRGSNSPGNPSKNDSMNMEESLSSVVLKSLSKNILCDVEIIGKDEVPVQAPSYLLAVHSEVFEEMLYSESNETAVKINGVGSVGGDKSSCTHRVKLAFATWDAIHAVLHFLATHALPEGLVNEANECNIRYVCQIHLIGRVFKIPSLVDQAYRTARLFMNKMPLLVCAAFDECNISTNLLSPTYSLPSSQDELKAYALEYLRDSPSTTLLAGGTMFLDPESIKTIICDQDMDVDELTMFHILHSWVKQDKDNNLKTGEALVSNINLSYIKRDHLNSVVKYCGFVDLSDVEAALKDIEDMEANQSPDEKEHVMVEGAGNDEINGIYVRMEEDIGLEANEIVFVKEAQEDEHCPDYALYALRSTWAITSCFDYSNLLYSCEATDGATSLRHQAPTQGWETIGGVDPPPTCMWNPNKDDAKVKAGGYVAPDLRECDKGGIDIANGDHNEGRICRRYTLRTMIALPTDEGYEDDDYHGDIDESNRSGSVT